MFDHYWNWEDLKASQMHNENNKIFDNSWHLKLEANHNGTNSTMPLLAKLGNTNQEDKGIKRQEKPNGYENEGYRSPKTNKVQYNQGWVQTHVTTVGKTVTSIWNVRS